MSAIEQEPSPSNPLEESAGLGETDQRYAKHLYGAYKKAVAKQLHTKEMRRKYPKYSDGLGFSALEASSASIKKSSRLIDAEAHYKKNEGAYQEQAVKDAAAEDVETDYGIGNRLVGLSGLSDKELAAAHELVAKLKKADSHNRELIARGKSSHHRSFGREVIEMTEEIKSGRELRRAEKEATRHYRKHEGQYQIQAVNDADLEGVETDYGT